jgi:non-specific serine/threonine protein kinase
MSRDAAHNFEPDPDVLTGGGLTRRECEVARLVAQGYSNRQIAGQLAIAASTAERHIANILSKLRARSRAEIAVWAVEHGLLHTTVDVSGTASVLPFTGKPAASRPRHNLPVQLTSFIGRVDETSAIREQLANSRLLTLAGPGGVGKTRLALHVAEQSLDTFMDGVWFVELSSLVDGSQVAQSVARALGLREIPAEPPIAIVRHALRHRHLLLILDNCERVVEASVELVDVLLRACPDLKVLITSREVLGIAAERVWRVPALRLPGSAVRSQAARVAESEAVALLVERAQAVQPGFSITDKNATITADLCQHLDGLPLAIELAAARLKLLTLEQIAERLDNGIRLLFTHDRTVPPRQQTLQATIEWSYDLLSERERLLFDRLSVFAGGWTIDAAEMVGSDKGLESAEVLDVLEQLVDKSLVVVENSADRILRYRFLETLHQYGSERLLQRGEAHVARKRHAEFFLRLFEQAAAEMRSGAERRWLVRLESERDNLEAALRWLVDQGDTESAQRLGAAAHRFWFYGGHVAEGRRWLWRLLAENTNQEKSDYDQRAEYACGFLPSSGRPAGVSPSSDSQAQLSSVRANLYFGLGQLAMTQGDVLVSEQALRRSLELRQRSGDTLGTAWALQCLGQLAEYRADFSEAQSVLESAVATSRTHGYRSVLAAALSRLAEVAREQSRNAEAQTRADEAWKIANTTGSTGQLCEAANILGTLYADSGMLAMARSVWQEALLRARETEHRVHLMVPLLINLGRSRLAQHDAEGRSLLAEGLLLAREVSPWQLARGFESTIDMLSEEGRQAPAERVLQLAGAAAALRDSLKTPLWPTEKSAFDRVTAGARHALSSEAGEAAWIRGHALSVDQALGIALAVINQCEEAAADSGRPA